MKEGSDNFFWQYLYSVDLKWSIYHSTCLNVWTGNWEVRLNRELTSTNQPLIWINRSWQDRSKQGIQSQNLPHLSCWFFGCNLLCFVFVSVRICLCFVEFTTLPQDLWEKGCASLTPPSACCFGATIYLPNPVSKAILDLYFFGNHEFIWTTQWTDTICRIELEDFNLKWACVESDPADAPTTCRHTLNRSPPSPRNSQPWLTQVLLICGKSFFKEYSASRRWYTISGWRFLTKTLPNTPR